jgi:hypothetical protein
MVAHVVTAAAVDVEQLATERRIERLAQHHVLRPPGGHDAAVEQDGNVEALAHTGEVVRGHDDGPPFIGELTEEVEQCRFRGRVEACSRLVQEENLRVANERSRDEHATLLTSTERVHQPILQTFEADSLEGSADARPASPRPEVAAAIEAHGDDIGDRDGEARRSAVNLGDVPDERARLLRTAPEDSYLTRPRFQEPDEQAKQGALPGAVGAEQPGEAALGDP